ncbi:MAG: hypothetical protein JJU08_10685, partial [Rhodobacteraceae bacterium]|nr:hypothetical protein [Paracoccaceae bacterium]
PISLGTAITAPRADREFYLGLVSLATTPPELSRYRPSENTIPYATVALGCPTQRRVAISRFINIRKAHDGPDYFSTGFFVVPTLKWQLVIVISSAGALRLSARARNWQQADNLGIAARTDEQMNRILSCSSPLLP